MLWNCRSHRRNWSVVALCSILSSLALAVLLFPETGRAETKTEEDPCADRLEELQERTRSLEAEIARLKPKTLRSSAGYKDTRWGMSPDEVKELYPKAKSDGAGTLVVESNVAGRSAATGFIFTTEKLTTVVVLFTESYVNKNNYVNDYFKVRDLLIKKYGEPAKKESHWSNTLYQGDSENIGMAVSAGHVTFWTTWDLEKTSIEASCSGEGFEVVHKILYKSKELAELEQRTGEADALSDL